MTSLPATADRVRVLRVIARLNIGGPALHATLLTERLDPCRYDSVLLTGSEERAEGNYLELVGKSVQQMVVVPSLGREIRPWRDVITFVRILRLIRRMRPEIVHTHTAKAGVLGRLAARLAGVPVIVHTYHGHVLQGYFPPAKNRLFVRIERALARWTDRLLAVSEAVRRDLLDLGIGTPDQLTVVPLGLDLDRFMACETLRGQLRAELGIGDAPTVGIVARLVPIKAHEVFFHAAALVARAVPASRFVVVGDGERRSELEDLVVSLGLANRVRFLGWRRDLDRIYSDLDVVALSSKNEGSPVSLIEAMAAACAVVATRVGGVPDLIEDGVNGYLVPSGDPSAMATAVSSLLTDPERRAEMGRAGRKRVGQAFSVERLVRDVDALYGELLARRAR